MAQLELVFENANKFYFEGEKVRGKLEVNVENSCNVKNILANFVGLSDVFEKSNDIASKIFSKTHTEVYFDKMLTLFAKQEEESELCSPGKEEFEFEYDLPESLPASVESPYGFVRYSIHVFAEIDGKTIKESEYFTVLSKTDLSKHVSTHLPRVLWKPEHQCFLQAIFCRANPVRVFLRIEKSGYVPGECLFINAEVCNFYMFPIEWVKANLVQVIKHSNSKSCHERKVAEIVRGCVLPSETQLWRSEGMLVPAVPPTTFGPKRLIKVKYKLLFQFKPSWRRRPVELKQKIVIGVVQPEKCTEEGQGERIYSSELFNSLNLEPCMFGPHIVQDEKRSVFTPLYPMYIAL